jgi:hypothetical protein
LIGYKLFRLLKDGSIAPLFINKRLRLSEDLWYEAECHPTKGFAVRPGWHVLCKPEAPHLTERGRVWKQVEVEDYQQFERPISQGGKWLLANRMRIIGDVC